MLRKWTSSYLIPNFYYFSTCIVLAKSEVLSYKLHCIHLPHSDSICLTERQTRMTSAFRRSLIEIIARLGWCAAQNGSYFQMSWYNLLVPTAWPLNMGWIDCPETLVTTNLRNISEEGISGRNMKYTKRFVLVVCSSASSRSSFRVTNRCSDFHAIWYGEGGYKK